MQVNLQLSRETIKALEKVLLSFQDLVEFRLYSIGYTSTYALVLVLTSTETALGFPAMANSLLRKQPEKTMMLSAEELRVFALKEALPDFGVWMKVSTPDWMRTPLIADVLIFPKNWRDKLDALASDAYYYCQRPQFVRSLATQSPAYLQVRP